MGEFPRMLHHPDGSRRVVSNETARDTLLAEGWLLSRPVAPEPLPVVEGLQGDTGARSLEPGAQSPEPGWPSDLPDLAEGYDPPPTTVQIEPPIVAPVTEKKKPGRPKKAKAS